eukprot:11841178-Alexandrium_andersonii.AAC.1
MVIRTLSRDSSFRAPARVQETPWVRLSQLRLLELNSAPARMKPRLFKRFPLCKSGREPSYVSRDFSAEYLDTLADLGRTAESFGGASGFSYQYAALEFQDNLGPDLKANHSRARAQPICGRAVCEPRGRGAAGWRP